MQEVDRVASRVVSQAPIQRIHPLSTEHRARVRAQNPVR
jgi:hypothetical protein